MIYQNGSSFAHNWTKGNDGDRMSKTKQHYNKLAQLFKKVGVDYFIAGIILMIVLAKIYPDAGLDTDKWSLPQLANWGITLIFFFYGLRLSKEKFLAGLTNWRLHVLIQLSTFLLFPLLLLALKPWFSHYQSLWLGAFYLASLPSTVSSSVVMVSAAGGNIAAAIFNASLSGILGIFLTPLWMSIAIERQTGTDNVLDTIQNA
jgi:solute carrier family 10 (sodium/bile acid cotransporter), member 7